MMVQLQNSNNPMQAMQSMLGNNPAFMRAQQMMQGKNPQQLKQTLYNLAQQRGIDPQQLQQMASQFGIKF